MSRPVKVFQPSGNLDSVSGHVLRQYISNTVVREPAIILIDMNQVKFADSPGLGALVSILKTLRSQDMNLYLCSIHGQVKMLLEMTSLDKVFEIYTSQEEFYQKHPDLDKA